MSSANSAVAVLYLCPMRRLAIISCVLIGAPVIALAAMAMGATEGREMPIPINGVVTKVERSGNATSLQVRIEISQESALVGTEINLSVDDTSGFAWVGDDQLVVGTRIDGAVVPADAAGGFVATDLIVDNAELKYLRE